jgi:hypothetical protein
MVEKHYCVHEDEFKQLAVDVTAIRGTLSNLDLRINGSLDKMKSHMEAGRLWRMTTAGLVVSFLLSGIVWVFYAGSLAKQVQVNTQRWDRLLEQHKIEI